jgi:hypothetical protein
VSGYKLQLSPGKKAVELLKGENEVLASAPCDWESGTWTSMRLQIRKTAEGQWQLQGKAWKDGSGEPAKWMIAHTVNTPPIAGRAGIWGMPYSGTPIRFDDLTVAKVE